MDVSHTEHSHVIGKGGNNIKKVMEETGCHIHFPDSNRNNQAEKSNQVSEATAQRQWWCVVYHNILIVSLGICKLALSSIIVILHKTVTNVFKYKHKWLPL